MTPQRAILSHYVKFDEPRRILLGDGKPTKAYGQGNVQFTTSDFSGELQSVPWVPELKERVYQGFATGSNLDETSQVHSVADE